VKRRQEQLFAETLSGFLKAHNVPASGLGGNRREGRFQRRTKCKRSLVAGREESTGVLWVRRRQKNAPGSLTMAAIRVGLDYTAMHALWRHVVGLFEEPNAFPSVLYGAQIFGRENQLIGSAHRVRRIDRDKAPDAG